MSTLFYRSSSVYIRFKQNGSWKAKSLGIDVDKVEHRNGKPIFPREALEIKRHIDTQIAFGHFGIEERVIPTLNAVLQSFLDSKPDLAEQSRYLYRLAVRTIVESAGDLPVSDYDESHFSAINKQSPNSRARTFRSLHAVFNYAVDREYLTRNPLRRFKRSVDVQPIVVFTNNELRDFLSKAREDDKALYDQCLFLLLTGFRASESCLLTWDQIDFDRKIIHHHNKKGRRSEHFPIDDLLGELLKGLTRRADDYVFEYRTRHQLHWNFKKVCKGLGFRKGLSVHTLKKTYASYLYASDANLLVIQRLAHHADIRTTQQHYISFQTSKDRQALKKSRRLVTHLLHPPEIR